MRGAPTCRVRAFSVCVLGVGWGGFALCPQGASHHLSSCCLCTADLCAQPFLEHGDSCVLADFQRVSTAKQHCGSHQFGVPDEDPVAEGPVLSLLMISVGTTRSQLFNFHFQLNCLNKNLCPCMLRHLRSLKVSETAKGK